MNPKKETEGMTLPCLRNYYYAEQLIPYCTGVTEAIKPSGRN